MKQRCCLFLHHGRMGKVLDQVTEPWHQEAFQVQEGAYHPLPLLLNRSQKKTTLIGSPVPFHWSLGRIDKFPQVSNSPHILQFSLVLPLSVCLSCSLEQGSALPGSLLLFTGLGAAWYPLFRFYCRLHHHITLEVSRVQGHVLVISATRWRQEDLLSASV